MPSAIFFYKKEKKRIELVEFYAMLPSSTQIKCEQLNIWTIREDIDNLASVQDVQCLLA